MTNQPDLDDIKKAWSERRFVEQREPARVDFAVRLLRELAKGVPVSAARAAQLVDGVNEVEAKALLRRAGQLGAELDASGALVGNALTLNATAHRIRVNGNDLYAWCSLDTLFLPGLIDAVADVESTCPVTGRMIRLTVGPEGVRSVTPGTAHVSVVVPGVTPECGPQSKTGPDSDVCQQMYFFATKAAAVKWSQDHPGVAILSVAEADEVARLLATPTVASDCC